MNVNHLAGGCCAACLTIFATDAAAINGLQLGAYGSKAHGMGGASIALPLDAMATTNNPAGLGFVEDRIDIGAQMLLTHTDSKNGPVDLHGTGVSVTPEFGYSHAIDDQWSVGISNMSNGAGFGYDNNIATGALDGTEGTAIIQVILPTVTYKPRPNLSFGFSLAPAFSALELKNFPGVTHEGHEYATGLGWRAGVLWRADDIWSFGAMYGSKIKMGSFDGYDKEILVGTDGALDVPEQYGVGIAVKLTPKLTLAADYLRIRWGDTQFSPLFGWEDQDVRRIGLNYVLSDSWTVRTGASYAPRTFDSDKTANNLLLVAINSKAVTFGATKKLSSGNELTFGLEYTFGSPAVGSGPSAGTEIDTDLVLLSVGYGF